MHRRTLGFYAFSDEDEAVRLATRLSGHPVRFHGLLQVEMSGEVLGFERGIRGARQRVLASRSRRGATGVSAAVADSGLPCSAPIGGTAVTSAR